MGVLEDLLLFLLKIFLLFALLNVSFFRRGNYIVMFPFSDSKGGKISLQIILEASRILERIEVLCIFILCY